MPSSTIWRRHSDGIDLSRRSPTPPLAYIEPLSPVLGPSPHTLERTHHGWNGQPSYEDSLHGLGVSYDALNSDRLGFEPSREPYIDENGQAHFGNARPTVNGIQNTGFSRSRYDHVLYQTREAITFKRSRGKGHTRSGSTIDDLASAAIATSPSFTQVEPGSPYSGRPATSYTYSPSHLDGERPYKRIRSEKLPSHEWSPREDGQLETQIKTKQRMHEAELLLSLRNGFDFKRGYGSPPARQKTFVVTARAHANSSRSVTAEGIANAEIAGVPPVLDESAPKLSPIQVKTSFDKLPTIESPQAPEPEPLTSPPRGESPDASNDASVFLTAVYEETQTVKKQEPIGTDHGIITGQSISEQNVADPLMVENVRRPRRVKPEVQAEVCAKCQHLQREPRSEDDDSISWIKCNPCNRWFHSACVGFKDKRETQTVDKFVCSECEPHNGSTTFVRKSSRARTAIDYAGLNQGLVKSSADTSMHHYVQPIKEGKIHFQPDNFARIRPELLTAEYFEKADSMKRPLVVPACWNPRFGDCEPVFETSRKDPEEANRGGSSANVITDNEDLIEVEVIDCDQDRLDMVMPRDLTVRKVAELYGPEEQVIVIDVKSQQSSNKWTMSRWADYYESTGDKPVRNVISLEITQSKLSRVIRRPKIVRDIDLQDLVWADASKTATYKPVQLYCLMSVADSYTDFHIDFGGSSVYYHILKGKKTFFFIPPEEKNLRKYEDWCNSDTQDSTFLGDLTGDCSRVDLEEGDTMFIPAGWIHAVWTPEDSLVIGGNFLTHTDYEMQLKIVEIEKNTGVTTKFRYPFFQKVMWYTLIKYLEDDPVPQEVIDDFGNDEDYVFLRANPVWHEFGELENHTEPGQPEYNARLYSKPEIAGLPALRDYLYRTALIYVDAPVVPPVTKESAKKVKASIPKTHGEPMDLIKLFAVWCAWKTGNITAPSWAHPDAVTLQKLAEKREKLKKPEIFRIPPERTSSRKSSQALSEVPMFNGEPVTTTPTKNNAGGVDAESDEGVKPPSSSKTSGLGPKRSACDACRKRRIRCRHREENEGSGAVETPPTRTISNITVEVPTMATVLSLPAVDTGVSPERQYPDFTDFVQSNIAQAALATMEQSVDQSLDLNNTPVTPSGKKGRSKACDECRKSKRRCVHDEFGRVDPAKAAEPSRPRGSANIKRTSVPGDELRQPQSKKPKLEEDDFGQGRPSSQSDFDLLIDPALMAQQFAAPNLPNQPFIADASDLMHSAPVAIPISTQEMNGLSVFLQDDVPIDTDHVVLVQTTATMEAMPSDSSLDKPGSDAPLFETVVKPEPTMEHVSSRTPATSLASPPDSMMTDAAFSPAALNGMKITTSVEVNGEKSETSPEDFYTPVSNSRHSSRQPKLVDRYIPETNRPMMKPMAKPAKADRRYSSSGASGESLATSNKSRRSSSNTSGTTHQMAAAQPNGGPRSRENSVRPGSRASTTLGDSEGDADEQFARELQAQENGLRRRTSGRA